MYSVSYVSADHVLVPRAGTSFVQCFAWSAKRGQMYLVCPTPCAVRLGITGAEHTRPCWYLLVPLSYSASLGQPRQCITCPGSYSYWAAQRGQMCLVCPTPCAVRSGITGVERTRPCWYLAGTSFVQCFAWSAQAMYHLPGLVLVLGSPTRANVLSLPYPLRSSLGYHGR